MHLFSRKSPSAGAAELLAAVLAVFGSVPACPAVVVVVGLATKTVLAGGNNNSRAGGLSEGTSNRSSCGNFLSPFLGGGGGEKKGRKW